MLLNTIGLIVTAVILIVTIMVTIIYGFYGFTDNKINDLKVAFFALMTFILFGFLEIIFVNNYIYYNQIETSQSVEIENKE